MSKFTLSRRGVMLGMASTLAMPSILRAQDYPTRPLNVVVPLAPGGYNDRLARAMLEPLGAELGQRLSVVNQAGAGTLLGNSYFQGQPADGYTVMCTNLPFIALTIIGGQAPYSIDDFTVINIPSRDYSLVATSAARGINSMDEVVERLRTNPNGLSVGLQPGSVDVVNFMLTVESLGVDSSALRFVTYDGGGAVRNAVMGGHVDIGVVAAEGYIALKDRIVPLMMYSEERNQYFSDTPTVGEVGEANGFEGRYVDGAQRSWLVRSALKEEHPDRFDRLISAFETVTKDPAVQEMLLSQDLESEWLGPDVSNDLFERTYASLSEHQHLLSAL